MIKSLNLPMKGIKHDFFILRNMAGKVDKLTILLDKRIPPSLSQKKLIAFLWELIQIRGELKANSDSAGPKKGIIITLLGTFHYILVTMDHKYRKFALRIKSIRG